MLSDFVNEFDLSFSIPFFFYSFKSPRFVKAMASSLERLPSRKELHIIRGRTFRFQSLQVKSFELFIFVA